MAGPGTLRPPPGQARPAEEPSIADLMSDALGRLSTLVRTELRLAQGEAVAKVKVVGVGLALLGAALVMALASVVMLLVTIMVVLAAIGVPTALAAFLALLVGLAGTAGLVWAGLGRLKADAMRPDRTLRQLQRDRQMVKEQVR